MMMREVANFAIIFGQLVPSRLSLTLFMVKETIRVGLSRVQQYIKNLFVSIYLPIYL